MPSSTVYNLLEACREPNCPICRLEQQSVERYLDNQFYENVNSPRWRDGLRASLGFCHEHAWLGIDKRLGDALGYTIIYRDVVNSVLTQLADSNSPATESRRSACRIFAWHWNKSRIFPLVNGLSTCTTQSSMACEVNWMNSSARMIIRRSRKVLAGKAMRG